MRSTDTFDHRNTSGDFQWHKIILVAIIARSIDCLADDENQ